MSNTGHRVTVQLPKRGSWVYCIQDRVIRGGYQDGMGHYLSGEEQWAPHIDNGRMTGELELGALVSNRRR